MPMDTRTFEDAVTALNGIIRGKTGPAGPDKRETWKAQHELMFRHLQLLELEEPVSRLSIIHVAGTKGKGSTCAFTESILRTSGLQTGLFTSPHLENIRERFRFNGVPVSEEIFCQHFWWCWDRLQACAKKGVPMPRFFRFLTLMALRMFSAENVDVVILEVGLGGRYDATNVVKAPAVCGITSLGFDHTDVLGHTLSEIASAKAGILKAGVPAFSAPQPIEAMETLQKEAEMLKTQLEVAPPLETYNRGNLRLGLEGDHQRINAALAIALCRCWSQRSGLKQHWSLEEKELSKGILPETYMRGLADAQWPGRAQIVYDKLPGGEKEMISRTLFTNGSKPQNVGRLTFYLDGAHTPESTEACAKWFCLAVKREQSHETVNARSFLPDQSFSKVSQIRITGYSYNLRQLSEHGRKWTSPTRVLLFNCMPKRHPQCLIPPILSTCSQKGCPIQFAIFVPPYSSCTFITSHSTSDVAATAAQTDVSWQHFLQESWEAMYQQELRDHKAAETARELLLGLRDDLECMNGFQYQSTRIGSSSAVIHSLPIALNWLRHRAIRDPWLNLQVLVTGSLYLVGDLLKLLKH
ncbi:hypothetical protein O6H91_08G047100 [Diphasiastrum complanatum]|uniref:Uncharacterized protein n=1 Tax=Diphasiastrum complanatum TaxID=34168 RepID=A0ACC2CY66_DIPCM|nr:hypothetical protein O6H91_08G047100 [Diphasiastrum complanatum]